MNKPQPLPQPVFCILLALSLRERHGYAIMQQVEEDSGGRITMGPGTLYGTIKKLLIDGLVEEAGERPVDGGHEQRRRYYRLTPNGHKQLGAELTRMAETVDLARKRNLLGDLQRVYI